jgi:hypothetical protein
MATVGQTADVPQTVLLTDAKAAVLAAKCRVDAMNRAHQDADSPAVRLPAPSLESRGWYGRALLSLTSLATDRGFAVEADLRRASLGSAELRGASLGSAELRGASLGTAELRGASLGTAVATVCTADTPNEDSTQQVPCPAGPQPYGATRIADGMLHVRPLPRAFGAVKIPLLG